MYSLSSKMWESYCKVAELELGGAAKVCKVSVTQGHSRTGWAPLPPGADVAHRSLSPRLACKRETEPHFGNQAVLFLRD